MAKERIDRKLFYRMMVPQNVALITSMGRDKKTNIMACSWFTPISFRPPMCVIAIKPSRHTHRLLKESKEFVLNFFTKDFAPQALAVGKVSGSEVDKIREQEFTKEPSEMIDVPRIQQAYVAIECRIASMIKVGDHDLITAEVLHVKLDQGLLKDGLLDLSKIEPLMYLSENTFCTTSDYIMKPKI